MTGLLARCAELPTRNLAEGDVLVEEGLRTGEMYVVADGAFEVVRDSTTVASIADPGAVIGEIAALLDTTATASVVATRPSQVHVIADPVEFMAADAEGLLEVTRLLATRLQRMTSYLADVRRQYRDAGGHLGLMDEVLKELAFGTQEPVDAGSERDPDPYY